MYIDIAANRKLTFGDIRATAEGFGKGLIANWAWRRGDTLALITSNSASVASVTFGALYAGGVVCPLNHLSTTGELAQSLKASNAKAVVTSITCLETVREAAKVAGIPHNRILLIDEVNPNREFQHFTSVQSSSQHLRRPQINSGEDVAFLVYSSGTTGLPKGVMLTHRNMVANMIQNDVAGENFAHWTRDKSLGFLPMYHIYGKSE